MYAQFMLHMPKFVNSVGRKQPEVQQIILADVFGKLYSWLEQSDLI